MSFHEVRFPTEISRGSTSGTERKTQIVVLGSGHEQRNSSWADSRRYYNAGYGIKTLDDLYKVVEFYEERRGRLYGFRWKDRLDCKSCRPMQTPQPVHTFASTRRDFLRILTVKFPTDPRTSSTSQ